MRERQHDATPPAALTSPRVPPVPSAATPALSVIVPAHRCAGTLRAAITALLASDLPREVWELIVVDDASGDETPTVAEGVAERVIRLTGSARGPGFARNRGVEQARAPIVAFVDADVCVHPETLRRLHDALAGDPTVSGVFGAYDTRPAAAGVVSRYRNLLHHWTHLRSAGPASTFWAGCGAIRRDAFLAVGGFDTERYPRPTIEDIDLGHRLTAAGYRLVLRPEIQCTHLKRWTLRGMIVTDVRQRGVPWVRLLLADPASRELSSLNLRGDERAFTALTGLAWLLLPVALLSGQPLAVWGALGAALVVVVGNLPLILYLNRVAGAGVALAAIPLRLLYYTLNCLSLAWGGALHLLDRRAGPEPVSAGGHDSGRCIRAPSAPPSPTVPHSEPS